MILTQQALFTMWNSHKHLLLLILTCQVGWVQLFQQTKPVTLISNSHYMGCCYREFPWPKDPQTLSQLNCGILVMFQVSFRICKLYSLFLQWNAVTVKGSDIIWSVILQHYWEMKKHQCEKLSSFILLLYLTGHCNELLICNQTFRYA